MPIVHADDPWPWISLVMNLSKHNKLNRILIVTTQTFGDINLSIVYLHCLDDNNF